MLFLVAFLILFFSFANNAKEQKAETEIAGNLQSTYLLPIGSPETPINERIMAIKSDLGATRQEIIAEMVKYPWNAEIALKIAICESGLNPEAVNWSDAEITGYASLGLFQLNRPEFESWNDYKVNIKLAYELYLRRGWRPWSCWQKL